MIFLFCLVLNNDGPEKNPGRAEAVVKQLEFLERKTQNLVTIVTADLAVQLRFLSTGVKIRLKGFIYTHTESKS
jgi:hypothetical protein